MEKLLVGHWVLCTAVHPRERDALAAQVAQCGGEFLTAFNIRDPPHLVITRSVRSPKYRALMRAHPHTPAVTPDWLTASVEVGARAGGGEAQKRAGWRAPPACHGRSRRCTDATGWGGL